MMLVLSLCISKRSYVLQKLACYSSYSWTNGKFVSLAGVLVSAEVVDAMADQMIAAPTLLADATSGAPTADANEQAFSNSGANKC